VTATETDTLRLATGPVSWGVDFADDPDNPPWESVLDEIAASPVDAIELGPIGYLPEEPRRLRRALSSRGLDAVGSFVFEDFHDPAQIERVATFAEHACRVIGSAGGAVLVIIDRPSPSRAETAGRSSVAARLPASKWGAMLEAVERVAGTARAAGLRPAVHPHAGGYIEFEDEIDRLLGETDVDLCLDSGHLLYAGIDPAEAITAYRSRLAHVHLKDIDRAVLRQVTAQAADFWAAVSRRVFCPIGSGAVDFASVLGALRDAGYDGFATIEQDRVAGTGSPSVDLARSLDFLRANGVSEMKLPREEHPHGT
jgi:inosose dehydratase